MEPLVTGLLTSAVWKTLIGGYSRLTDSGFQDYLESAAEETTEGRPVSADGLIVFFESELVEERVEAFEENGVGISTDELADALARELDPDLDVEAETLVEEFFRNLERELSQDEEVWRRIEITYSQELAEEVAEVQEAVEQLKSELEKTRNRVRLEDRLRSAGFQWLKEKDFQRRDLDSEACWRRPFTFTEIAADYAIDRERLDDDRTNVTEELLAELRGGNQKVLLGLPGSGKTTICKSVAHRWHEDDDTGSVFYRKSGVNVGEEGPDVLREAIEHEKDEGPVLVVVEDAARSGSLQFFPVIDEFTADPNVSLLLDSRKNEWERLDERFRREGITPDSGVGKDVLELWRKGCDRSPVPPLDEREVGRVIDKFEEITGDEVSESAEEILDRIRTTEEQEVEAGAVRAGEESTHWASPMLLLTYHLPVGDVTLDGEGGPDSALERNVLEVFQAVNDPDSGELDIESDRDEKLLRRLGLLINLLNAAEVGVYRKFVHALAENRDEHEKIDGFLADLQGKLHFGIEEGTKYWANHPLWSELYLDMHLSRSDSESVARVEFEESVNALFRLLDSEDRRNRVERWVGTDHTLLSVIEEAEISLSDLLVESVFEVGTARPKLVSLYSTTRQSRIKLPDSCSKVTRLSCIIGRGDMYRYCGEFETAIAEYERIKDFEERENTEEEAIRATFLNQVGVVAFYQSDYETAEEYYLQSLNLKRKLGNRQGEANTLGNLGIVAAERGDYEAAEEYHQQSLSIQQDLNDTAGKAKSLGNLGSIVRAQGDYEAAEEYHRQSLDLERKLGNRIGEASSLNNLGLVAKARGNYDAAAKYHLQCLKIARKLGNLQSESNSLNNLGSVAIKMGDYRDAQTYYQQSLALKRELGDRAGKAKSLEGLGLVARAQGNYEAAEEYHQQSLSLVRKLGDRQGEARSLNNLGLVTKAQNNYNDAEEYTQQSLNIQQELGNLRGEANSLGNLGHIAEEQGNYETARYYYEKSKEIFCEIGAIRKLMKTYDILIKTVEKLGDDDQALEWCNEVMETIRNSDTPGLEDRYRQFRFTHLGLEDKQDNTRLMYNLSLQGILNPDARLNTNLQQLREIWNRHEIHEQDSDAYRATLAAGIALAAITTLFGDKDLDTDCAEVLDTIELYRDRLAMPEAPVYEFLVEGETDVTPDDLREGVDTDDPDLPDFEAEAFAQLLAGLQDEANN